MAKGAGYAAFLGAVLIGVAVIIGIVLLQIGDRNDNGPASTHPKTTTTKKASSSSTTSTTKPTSHNTKPPKSPSQIHLIVLNGGAASGQAAHMESSLRLRGYTSQDTANTWSGHHQSGNTVYCKAGLAREGAALAAQVPGAHFVLGYPKPVPPFSAGTDCVVVVGS